MSADLPSSNPFRRKGAPAPAPAASPTTLPDPAISTVNPVAYQQIDKPLVSPSIEDADPPKKAAKKVRVQSPPPSPSIPDSTSTIGEDTYLASVNTPKTIPQEDDPFDGTSSESGEDEEVAKPPSQAPPNPFSKTLETMENPGREVAGIPQTNVAGTGRASLDVEAFKRLLMTGNSGLGTSTPPSAAPPQVVHGVGDGGSSTDASSVSRQSIFDAIQEAHNESPRTSHELSEPEDDRKVVGTDFTSMSGVRKKPPPPSSRHGKLIKVELRDDPSTVNVQYPNTPGSAALQTLSNTSPRSLTDLNKPLPPAPTRSSQESDRESIFDREAAGKTPRPPSPSASIRKKTPPAPPLTRRHSQLVSESKLSRSDSGRLSPKVEEDAVSIRSVDTVGRSRSDSARAPPPPPTRRPVSIRGVSNSQLTSPTSSPAPPPARGSSRSLSGRPPSLINVEVSAPSKRISMVSPPPPPPHRHGRSSMDGGSPDASQRVSGEMNRKSIESVRRGSDALSFSQVESAVPAPPAHDLLADLNALQREIDALRSQPTGKENVT